MLQKMIMPKLGDTMEEGTIEAWRVKQGDRVEKRQVVMEIATDKAVLEVESLVEGMMLKILIEQGQTVPIGTVVAYVGQKGDALPEEDP